MVDVASSGARLAFVVFAKALSSFADNGIVCSIFAVMFFGMLMMLGLDSAFAWVETVQTYVHDWLRSKNPGKPISKRLHVITLIVICTGGFCCGLLFATRAGFYYVDLMDHYCPTYCLLTAAIAEYILFGWCYGSDKIIEHIRTCVPDTQVPGLKQGSKYEYLWHFQMKWVGPIILGLLFVNQIVCEFTGSYTKTNHSGRETYGGYPFSSTLFLGWGSYIVPLIVAIFAAFSFEIQSFCCGKAWPGITKCLGLRTHDRLMSPQRSASRHRCQNGVVTIQMSEASGDAEFNLHGSNGASSKIASKQGSARLDALEEKRRERSEQALAPPTQFGNIRNEKMFPF